MQTYVCHKYFLFSNISLVFLKLIFDISTNIDEKSQFMQNVWSISHSAAGMVLISKKIQLSKIICLGLGHWHRDWRTMLRTMCIDISAADIEEKKIFIKSSCLLKHLTKAQNLGLCLQDGIQNLTLEQADSKDIFFKISVQM